MNYNNLDQLNLDDMASLFYENFTVTLIAINELHISTGVEILGPRIAIYADKILHKGSLNSSYWGCEPG
jgi:N-dimethylarginine dimethylaminohydrolase